MTKTTKNWCPEYKYESINGNFVDYRGQKRDYTMVAVSIPMYGITSCYEGKYNLPYNMNTTDEIAWYNNYEEFESYEISKMLSIGIAVRCVRDEDTGLGERIAYGKAVKLKNHTLFVSHPGMVNTKMVQALLEQEAAHFEKDPGSYITNYNADRDRYKATGKIAAAELTAEEVQKMNNTSGRIVDVKNIPVKQRMQNEADAM